MPFRKCPPFAKPERTVLLLSTISSFLFFLSLQTRDAGRMPASLVCTVIFFCSFDFLKHYGGKEANNNILLRNGQSISLNEFRPPILTIPPLAHTHLLHVREKNDFVTVSQAKKALFPFPACKCILHICSYMLPPASRRRNQTRQIHHRAPCFFLNAAPYPPNAGIGRKNRKPEPSHGLPNPSFAKRHKRCAPFRPAFPVPEYRNSCRRLFSDNKQRLITELVLSKKTQAQEPACPSTKFFHPFTNSFTQRKKPKSMDNGHTGHTCIRTPSYPTSFSRPPYQKDKCRYILRAEQRKMP